MTGMIPNTTTIPQQHQPSPPRKAKERFPSHPSRLAIAGPSGLGLAGPGWKKETTRAIHHPTAARKAERSISGRLGFRRIEKLA
jgi:hypothetical protein